MIFIGTLILAALNIHWARSMLLKKSEDYARLLMANLNHQVFLQFVIPVTYKFGRIQLSNPEQFKRMDTVVRNTLHSFKIETVNIYDSQKNIISYSFDDELVGQENLGGTGYQKAAAGEMSSELVQRGNIWEIPLGFPKESKLITFAPLRAEKQFLQISGPVLGVVEVVQNLSEEYKTIFRFQLLVIFTCTVVMAVLFLILINVVRKGEGIIERRALERLRLEEQLSHAKHLSALGEMTAGISHEIRNPLGIIRSSAELLKKKVAEVDPDNAIPDIIMEESGRLNNIITDFLNYAKPKTPQLQTCNIIDIIEKNLNFLAPQIEEQNFTIKKDFSQDVAEIDADADMLYQAFLNILINAMQATPGGGEIQIEVLSGKRQVTVLFEDEGDGVPDDLLHKIWDPFFTTKEKGTGLGLGIVKNIIESHNGEIRIENKKPLNGARVTVDLPVRSE